jgi:hypothetical protein
MAIEVYPKNFSCLPLVREAGEADTTKAIPICYVFLGFRDTTFRNF